MAQRPPANGFPQRGGLPFNVPAGSVVPGMFSEQRNPTSINGNPFAGTPFPNEAGFGSYPGMYGSITDAAGPFYKGRPATAGDAPGLPMAEGEFGPMDVGFDVGSESEDAFTLPIKIARLRGDLHHKIEPGHFMFLLDGRNYMEEPFKPFLTLALLNQRLNESAKFKGETMAQMLERYTAGGAMEFTGSGSGKKRSKVNTGVYRSRRKELSNRRLYYMPTVQDVLNRVQFLGMLKSTESRIIREEVMGTLAVRKRAYVGNIFGRNLTSGTYVGFIVKEIGVALVDLAEASNKQYMHDPETGATTAREDLINKLRARAGFSLSDAAQKRVQLIPWASSTMRCPMHGQPNLRGTSFITNKKTRLTYNTEDGFSLTKDLDYMTGPIVMPPLQDFEVLPSDSEPQYDKLYSDGPEPVMREDQFNSPTYMNQIVMGTANTKRSDVRVQFDGPALFNPKGRRMSGMFIPVGMVSKTFKNPGDLQRLAASTDFNSYNSVLGHNRMLLLLGC